MSSYPSMTQHVVPMLHVPDVRATATWYESIGFELFRDHREGAVMTWALLALYGSEIMLNAGGPPSSTRRRNVDLYIHTRHLDAIRAALVPEVAIVEEIHDTAYGMRELIIRDVNGFWITFGAPS